MTGGIASPSRPTASWIGRGRFGRPSIAFDPSDVSLNRVQSSPRAPIRSTAHPGRHAASTREPAHRPVPRRSSSRGRDHRLRVRAIFRRFGTEDGQSDARLTRPQEDADATSSPRRSLGVASSSIRKQCSKSRHDPRSSSTSGKARRSRRSHAGLGRSRPAGRGIGLQAAGVALIADGRRDSSHGGRPCRTSCRRRRRRVLATRRTAFRERDRRGERQGGTDAGGRSAADLTGPEIAASG
jgi:hypothetical protein